MAREISLKVPESIDLEKMSEEEVERYALEMSKKAMQGLPDESVLNVDRITLTRSAVDWSFYFRWSRACFSAELDRAIKVDPEVFENPINEEIDLRKSASIRITRK